MNCTLDIRVIFIVIILLLQSCAHNRKVPIRLVKDFKIEKELNCKKFSLDSNKILSLDNICIADSLLILKSSDDAIDPNNKYFTVYKIVRTNNNIKFQNIGKFGDRGKGPNEFIHPHFNNQIISYDNSACLWVHDLDKYAFYLVNISLSARKKRTMILKKVREPKMIDLGMNVFVLRNNDLCGNSFNCKGRMFYYSDEQKKVTWSVLFPEIKEKEKISSKDLIYFFYEGVVRIKPDQKKIVSALYVFKEIDVFNISAQPEISIVFNKKNKIPDMLKDPDNPLPDDLRLYYNDLVLTNNHIYALLSEMSNNENEDEKYDNIKSIIQIFDWNGNPLVKITLDRYYDKIAVDEKGMHIIAYSKNDDEHLFVFNLNEK